MDFVFPRLDVPASAAVSTTTHTASTSPSLHVSLANDLHVQVLDVNPRVSMHPTPLRSEGVSAALDETTALLPPPVTARRRARAAGTRPGHRRNAAWPSPPAAMVGAFLGCTASTAWWAIAAIQNGGQSPISTPAVFAVLAGGAAFGGFIGLFTDMQDRDDARWMRGMLYEA